MLWPIPASGQTQGVVPPSELLIGSNPLASGLSRPTAVAAPDDGSDRLLIAEKPGTVRVYRIGQGMEPGTYLDIRGLVSTSGNERGLLGIATSPDFTDTHTLFLAYTRSLDNAVVLSRFVLESADQSPVPSEAGQVILVQPHAEFSNHNGGQIAFGPDGYLYWGIGDGGGAGDPLNAGQDLNTLLGKILRIGAMDYCGWWPYCVPPDNPITDGRGEIWAYGLRNPWRFSFDPADGSLWIGDVGQNQFEEVNRLAANQGGANLGWSCREGPVVFNQSRCRAGEVYVDPIFTYRTRVDGCSVIGGHVYRGSRHADIAEGTYVATDYCNGSTWGIQRDASGSYQTARIGTLPDRPTSFGTDADGELYLVTDGGGLYEVSFQTR